jgi:hypothetical protein
VFDSTSLHLLLLKQVGEQEEYRKRPAERDSH